MKSFLRRLFGKAKPSKEGAPQGTAQAGQTPATPRQKPKPKKRTDSSFEPLEGRIAPALLLNPTTIQYTDVDGDLVTVKFSKALFTKTGTPGTTELDAVFKFKDSADHVRSAADGGSASDVAELGTIDLTALSISSINNPAAGVNITITASPKNGMGNDLVNIGYIKASNSIVLGTSLGAVVVDGDLGQIDAGDTGKAIGVASLTVQTMGAVGTTSQLGTPNVASLESTIVGKLGKLVVKGNYTDAVLKVVSSSTAKGIIGSITIGGSLGVSTGTTTADIAQISADVSIGAVKVGTQGSDGIFGGAGANTGLIKTSGKIGSVTVSGDIRGGAGKDSGEISGSGGIGNVTLGGSLWAGTGENSGRIVTNNSIGLVKLSTIHGEQAFATGDAGKNAGTISAAGNIAALTTVGDILGGKNEGSGSVKAGGTISKLVVGGNITGGDGKDSGRINAGALGPVSVGRVITGGVGANSGSITSTTNITSLTLQNSFAAEFVLVAGKGVASGAITAGGNIGVAKISGGFDGTRGGALGGQLEPPPGDPMGTPVAQLPGIGAASVQAQGSITSVTMTGNLKGGPSEATGTMSAGLNIGTLKLTGNAQGGGGLISGSVIASGKIGAAMITGKLIGGAGDNSGALIAGLDTSIAGTLGATKITGGLEGGTGAGSGSVRAGGKIISLTIGVAGAGTSPVLTGAAGNGSGSIFADDGAGSILIHGTVQGGGGVNSGAVIASGVVTGVQIKGALAGSTGEGSGSVQVRDIDLITSIRAGDLGTLTVTGAVTGNIGIGSGRVYVEGTAKAITLGSLSGGVGDGSGGITVGAGMAALLDDYTKVGGAASITIKGALVAGAGVGTAVIDVASKLGALTIEGAATNATVHVGRDLGKLKITGAVDGALVTALGQAKPTAKTDVAIGSITLGAGISNSRILAGYDRFDNPLNGNAQIGTVAVTGNWTASSLVAGVEDVDGDGFGDADDIAIASLPGPVSKIASIIISGNVTGTDPLATDHFGFTAKMIGSMKIAGAAQALTAGTDTIPLAGVPATNDTAIREVA